MEINKVTKYSVIGVSACIVLVLAFFISYNAEWLLGDDAIIINHTGFGIPFYPSEFISTNGRCFPGAYLMYNVLLPFFDGNVPPLAHYILHSIVFVAFAICLFALFVKLLEPRKSTEWVLVFASVFVIVFRMYSSFLNAFSTLWFGYFLMALFLLLYVNYIKSQKSLYAVLAVVVIFLYTYRLETNFVPSLVLGISGLLFCKNTKKDKLFYGALLLNAIVFLLVYFFAVYLNSTSFYGGSHGSDVSLFRNAFTIFLGQKFLWLAVIVLFYRVYKVLKDKDTVKLTDLLLLVAAAQCCAGWILRLNWTMYYYEAIMLSVPAVAVSLKNLVTPKWATLIMLCFVILQGKNIPKNIMGNQKVRIETAQNVRKLANVNEDLIWYEPVAANKSFDVILRQWERDVLQTYVAYLKTNKDFKFIVKDEFDNTYGLWLCSKKNESLVDPSVANVVNNSCSKVYGYEGVEGYLCE